MSNPDSLAASDVAIKATALPESFLSRRGGARYVRESLSRQQEAMSTPESDAAGDDVHTFVSPAVEAPQPAQEAVPAISPDVFNIFSGYSPDDNDDGYDEPTAPEASPATSDDHARELTSIREQLRLAEEERESLIRARKAELEELEELRRMREKLEADRLYDFSGVEFDTIDSTVAQEFGNKIVKPVVERQRKLYETNLQQVKQDLEAVQQERLELQRQLERQKAASKLESTNAKIFEEHPDFEELRGTKAFTKFLQSNVANSSTKLGDMIANEYYKGNYKFVNQAVAAFKSRHPSLQGVATTSATSGSSTPGNHAEQSAPDYSLDDLLHALRTRAITREEYRERLRRLS